MATALIRPLEWELPYAVGAVLKRKKKKKELMSCLKLYYIVDGTLFFLFITWRIKKIIFLKV